MKQGDPLSPILFNNVTRGIFETLKDKWSRRGFGVPMGSRAEKPNATHVMFADDTTLLATSEESLREMIEDVDAAMRNHGLKLNFDKNSAHNWCKATASHIFVNISTKIIAPKTYGQLPNHILQEIGHL